MATDDLAPLPSRPTRRSGSTASSPPTQSSNRHDEGREQEPASPDSGHGTQPELGLGEAPPSSEAKDSGTDGVARIEAAIAPGTEPVSSQPAISPQPSAEPAPVRDTRPPLARGADLGRAKTPWPHLLGLFGLVAVVYLLLLPRFLLYSSPPTGDQPTYMMVTMSILQDGDLNLKNNFAQRDEDKFYRLAPHPPDFVGMSAPYPLPPHGDLATARPNDTELYNPHFPGLSIMIIPAWIVGGWFQLWWPVSVAFMCLLGALVAVNIFMLAHELTGRLWIAWVVTLSLAFVNPLMSYSYMIFSELPTALLTIYAFRRLALGWGANGPWRRALIGLCIAYIPWLAWRSVIVAAPLGIYAAIQWARYHNLLRAPKWWRQLRPRPRSATITTPLEEIDTGGTGARLRASVGSAIPFLAPIALSAALLLWYDYFHYGGPIPAATVPELGPNVSPFKWPWAGIEELTHFVFNLFAHMFDRPMGLITNAPIYVLSFVGMVALFRSRQGSDRRLLFAILLISIPLIGLVSAFVYWNGLWNPPARYLTIVAPLMAAPLAMSLYAAGGGLGWIYRGIYALLMIPGLAWMAIRMNDARRFWPADSISGWLYENELSPVRNNLDFAVGFENMWPAFSPVDDLRLPGNTAWMLIAGMGILLVSYFVISRPRPPTPDPRPLSPQSSVLSPQSSPLALCCALAGVGGGAGVGMGWVALDQQGLSETPYRADGEDPLGDRPSAGAREQHRIPWRWNIRDGLPWGTGRMAEPA